MSFKNLKRVAKKQQLNTYVNTNRSYKEEEETF